MFYKNNKFYSKIICLFILMGLIFSPSLSLQALQVSAQENIAQVSEDQNRDINKELKEKLDLLRVEQVLNSVQMFQESDSLITKNEWDELELDKIVDNWEKYTKTKLDIWGIKTLLKFAPVGSKEIIRVLIEDDAAFANLNEVMDKVASAQNQLISYWDQMDILNCQSKSLYYAVFSKLAPKINNFLNSNKLCLGTCNSLGYVSPVYNILGAFGLTNILINYALFKGVGLPFEGWKKSFVSAIKSPFLNHNPVPNVFKNGFYDLNFMGFTKLGDFTLGDKYLFVDNILKNLLSRISVFDTDIFDTGFCDKWRIKPVLSGAGAAIIVVGLQAFFDYYFYTSVKGSLERINFLYQTSAQLQENIVKVADMFRALNKLQEDGVLGELGQEGENCFAVQNIVRFLKKEGVANYSGKLDKPEGKEQLAKLAELNELLEKLASSTFKSKSSLFYSSGNLLSTHKLMNEVKEQLIPLLQNVALMAGYRTIAQIFREHRNSRAKFCFVEFVGTQGPVIDLESAWIPLICADKVVTNDCKFGVTGNPCCAVVTGPNGGGKSTFMITVAFNVLLSKLGIAAADSAAIADFDKIRTSLRPAQDIASGLSTFMAEHKRVEIAKQAINSCKGNILVLLDEPFKGTVEVESACRVYDFGKYVAQNHPNCVLLMATHLRRPIDLANDMGRAFRNLQMGYIENGPCNFERTFKVQDGPAIWWFDDADKRGRFIDWLCANEICA